MSNFTDVFGGNVISPAIDSYQSLALSQATQLFWPQSFVSIVNSPGNAFASDIIEVVPTGNFIITLPDATLAAPGNSILFVNKAGGAISFRVAQFGGNVLLTLAQGAAYYIYLTDNTTQPGAWSIVPFAAGVAAVTSVGATSNNNNLTIAGSPITAAGSFTFNFANDILALTQFMNNTGIAARTAANTWALRLLTGTANQITIVNGDGVAGNPTFSLPNTVDIANTINVGNLQLSGNTLISQNVANLNLILSAQGSAPVALANNALIQCNSAMTIMSGNSLSFYDGANGNFTSFQAGNMAGNIVYTWPTAAPSQSQVLQVTNAGPNFTLGWANVTTFGGPSTVNAVPRYTNIAGALGNTNVLIDNTNNLTVPVGSYVQAGNLGLARTDANTIVSTNANGAINLLPNGTGAIGIGGFQYPNVTSMYWEQQESRSLVLTQTAGLFQFSNSIMPNLVLNGGMRFSQRGPQFTSAIPVNYVNNDGTYTLDRWLLKSNGNNIVNVAQVSTTVSGATFYSPNLMQFTVQTANTKFGIAQFFPASLSKSTLGPLSISFAAYGTNITNLRAAIISWSGASDRPTKNFVAAWNAAGTNPTLGANWTYQNTPMINISITGAATRYKVENITLNLAGINNLALFIWVDDTTAPNGAILNLSCVKVEVNSMATMYLDLPYFSEYYQLKQYFQTDFDNNAFIYTNATTSTRGKYLAAATTNNGIAYANVQFTPALINSGNNTYLTYGIANATHTGQASDNTGADLGANSAVALAGTLDTTGVLVYNNSGGGINTTNFLQFHWYVDAELGS